MDDRTSHWHGYQSALDWLKAQMALTPLLAAAGFVAISLADARYDERYVRAAALSNAVQTIQLSQNEQQISTIETQLQIAYRRLNAETDPAQKAEIQDEIRVLEDAKAAAQRQRERIMKAAK